MGSDKEHAIGSCKEGIDTYIYAIYLMHLSRIPKKINPKTKIGDLGKR